ncbi:MAG TPA: hypothetical protein VL974_06245 [Magnetospirillum sp.]|jgi:hypothetical protein|nr:hypothetical protein [Magnetospirillum sp.]
MSKLLIPCGIAVLAASALATLAAVFAGSMQWLGLAEPFGPALPPQSLVVGGLFLGVPVAALGWAIVWFGGWLRNHG